MKLLGLVALIAGAHAAANTDEYIYVKTFGAIKATGGSATDCSGTPGAAGAKFLLKAVQNMAEKNLMSSLAGYCLSYLQATFEMISGVDTDGSLYIAKDTGTAGKYVIEHFGAPFCHDIVNEATHSGATYFLSLSNHADTNCGGSGTATGIIVKIGGSGSRAVEMSGTLIKGKSMFGSQLQGPFSDTLCVANAANLNQYPHSIPLEDISVTGVIQSTTTTGTCNVWSLAATSNKYTTQILKSSTAGDIVVRIRSGSGSTAACASGTTVHNITFSADARGRFASCVQAKDNTTDAVVAAGYYKLILDDASAGIWPNIKEFPTAAPGTTPGTAPASTMHVSAALAAALALIAALM